MANMKLFLFTKIFYFLFFHFSISFEGNFIMWKSIATIRGYTVSSKSEGDYGIVDNMKSYRNFVYIM